MHGHVPVALLKPVVFPHIVKVVSPDSDGALHLQLLHHASQDAATDGHITSEGTLLVNIGPLNGLSGGLEAQANLAQMALGFAALLTYCLGVKEDSRLLLESLLRLQQQQPCGC